jgi:hypothetical protein
MKRPKCEGSMYPQQVLNRKLRGLRYLCPFCFKDLAATFRTLGARGSGCGYESYIPKHVKGGK